MAIKQIRELGGGVEDTSPAMDDKLPIQKNNNETRYVTWEQLKKLFVSLGGTESGFPISGQLIFEGGSISGAPDIHGNTMSAITIDGDIIAIGAFDTYNYQWMDKGGSLRTSTSGAYMEHVVDKDNPINNAGISASSDGINVFDSILNKGLFGSRYFGANYDDNTYVQKYYIDTHESIANKIKFSENFVFGSRTTPLTGNITNDLTNARIGVVQKIYHNGSVEPTFPAGWVLIGDGIYIPNTLNIIYCEWSEGSTVEYWITQG